MGSGEFTHMMLTECTLDSTERLSYERKTTGSRGPLLTFLCLHVWFTCTRRLSRTLRVLASLVLITSVDL